MEWKVGDRFVLIDPKNTALSQFGNREIGIVTSLTFPKNCADPQDNRNRKILRSDCVYGIIGGDEYTVYVAKDCIAPLTPLDELL